MKLFRVEEMYRVSVQPQEHSADVGEDHNIDIDDEVDIDDKIDETNNPVVPTHQIVNETDDMIEINLLNEEPNELSKKSSSCDLERASINSNDQLMAATSAMVNGASIIYMTQVNFSTT